MRWREWYGHSTNRGWTADACDRRWRPLLPRLGEVAHYSAEGGGAEHFHHEWMLRVEGAGALHIWWTSPGERRSASWDEICPARDKPAADNTEAMAPEGRPLILVGVRVAEELRYQVGKRRCLVGTKSGGERLA